MTKTKVNKQTSVRSHRRDPFLFQSFSSVLGAFSEERHPSVVNLSLPRGKKTKFSDVVAQKDVLKVILPPLRPNLSTSKRFVYIPPLGKNNY